MNKRKDNDFIEAIFTIIGAIAAAAAVLLIGPLISFWLYYFGGWIASIVIGNPLCTALNTAFNTTRFTPDQLPLIAGALGWIGGYFHSKNLNIKND